MSECCVGCRLEAPEMDGENTLRSTLGWRLIIERLPTGETLAAWRCPDCWTKYKARRQSMPPPKS